MTPARLLLAPLLAAALLAGVERAQAAPSLSPFRTPGSNPAGLPSPLRQVSQAAGQSAPTAAPAPQACTSDAQCPAGTICENGTCQAFERPINVLLFRKEGGYTAFIPFYFHQRGGTGYRVLAPLYWHFWSPESRARIVAPFYWRFEDHLKQRVVVVIPPFSYTSQPDARSSAVWPLFYYSSKFGWAAPLLGSFKIASPDQGRSFGLYAFLYFWKRSPASKFDLFFPLFVSKRSTDSAFTFTLPLNFYWRSWESRSLLMVPLFYWNGNPDGSTFASLLGYRSRAGESTRGSIAWLYWWGRGRDRAHDVLFPLLWSFRSPQSSTTIVPPVAYLRRGDWSLGTVFPLGWWATDRAAGSSWKLVFPLFFARARDHGRQAFWLTPLGGYRRNDDAGESALTWIAPPIIRRRSPDRELDVWLLLYWRYRDIRADSTTTLAGPLYRRDDPGGSTRVLFPFYWSFRDQTSGASAHALLPFYFWRRSPDETTLAAGPVFPLWFYHRRFSDGGSSTGFFPLAFFGRRRDERHAVVFPLFWHFRSERRSATLAFPVFYRFADRQGAVAGVPPLLYFQGHDSAGSYKVQFPLFWRFVDARRGTATTVVPPVFVSSGREGWSAGLFPLVFARGGGPRRHFVLVPFIWRFRDDASDRSTLLVLNYLHRRHGGERTDALLPLVYYRRGAKPGGADETSFTLFPLAHYRRDQRRTLFVSPIAAWQRTPERQVGAVIPYFWYRSKGVAASGVPPLWFDVTTLATGERRRLFGPLFLIDAPGRSARVLFPLYARYRDQKETGTYLFPTYFRRRTTDGYAVDTLFPLFWRSRGPGYGATVVGTWFARWTPDRYSTGLLPLYVYTRTPKRRLLASPVFVRHENVQEGTRQTWSLLFFHASRPDGYTNVVFPLWWARQRGPRTGQVLFPLFWRFVDDDQKTAFTLAGPFLSRRNGNRYTNGVLPLLWYSRDPDNGIASHAVLPFFYERHGRQERMVLTLPFGYRRAPDRGWWYVGPLFRRTTWNTSFTTLVPLWFEHWNRVTETRTRVVPPLLHYSRKSPDRALSGFLLLFWRHRDITSSTTLGIPLFWDFHSFHQRRLTMLLPLFVRHRSEVTGQTYTLAPLLYRRSGPTDSATVLFPLVWDFRSPERSTTFVFPVYAGFKRPDWEGRYIFPNIWYRTGRGPAAGTSRLFVFPLWESRVRRPGDYMWEVLLGLFGYERIGRNRYVKVLFYPFEIEPVAPAQTSWQRPARATRRQKATGLATQVW